MMRRQSSQRLLQLHEKINTYLEYVVSKRVFADFPHASGRPIRFQLDCSTVPDASVVTVLGRARELLRPYGIVDVSYKLRRV
jgi:hypothetical protein